MLEKTLVDHLFDLVDKLNENEVEYTLIGGFAVILYGSSRTTGDIDLLVRTNESNIQKLKKVLFELYNEEDIDEITEKELTQYSVIRLGTEFDFYIDIIGSIGTAFNFENIESIDKFIEGHRVRIASPKSLIEMKKNTYREIDAKDLFFLQHYLRKDDESKKI